MNVAPTFVSNFKNKCETLDGFRKFQESVKHLYKSVLRVLDTLHKLEELKLSGKRIDFNTFGSKTAVESFKMTLIGAVLFDLPTDYTTIIQNFYSVSFKVFCNCGYPAFGTYDDRVALRGVIFTRVLRDDCNLGTEKVSCSEHPDQTLCNCMKALGAFDCVNK